MRLLMIGPPGSGKGTQAARLAAHYGITHISSGDLLRHHVATGTGIGRAAAAYINRGDLVPDGVVMDLLRRPVEAATAAGGYLLDGFPRTVTQADTAYAIARELGAEVRTAIHLHVPRPELVARLLARGRDSGRVDDTAAVINHRLDVFNHTTEPLLDYYRHRETLISADGDRPIADITADLINRIDAAYATRVEPAAAAQPTP